VNARILAVDDEPEILRALETILRGAGYEIDTAATGEQALGQAALRLPDAVLLDPALAERVRGAAGSQDQVVVADVAGRGVEGPGGEVDALHFGEAELEVALAAQDGAHRFGDLFRLEPGGGDLVEQRLEEVVVAPVDQDDAGGSAAQDAVLKYANRVGGVRVLGDDKGNQRKPHPDKDDIAVADFPRLRGDRFLQLRKRFR